MKPEINRPGFARALSVLLAMPVLAMALSARAQCPPRSTQDFDSLTPPALPGGWVASQGVNVTGAPLWVTSNVASHTWPNDAFSTAPDNILDNRLDTPLFLADPFALEISFQNNYNLESGRDGAVLEISSPNINGGAFTDITDPAVGGSVSPGYNSLISSAFQSPIAGRMAWSGNSGGYVTTQAFLGNAAFPPSEVKLRFRLVSDNSGASAGWRIDTFVQLSNECSSPTPTPTPCPVQPWTFVADYPLGVIEQSAVGSDGAFVYSAGGYTFPAETDAFYRYNPVANSWTTLPPLPASLAAARVVYAPNTNSFYVFGGLTQSQSTVLDTTYIYNVGTNTWTTGAPMPAARYFPNVVYYAGKIFVIGGHSGGSEANQTWEYDPGANTWSTARANIPVAMGGSATGVAEHFIYLIGHLNGGAGSTLHYRYDISLNTWALMAPAPAVVYEPMGATIGRQVYVVGGPNHAKAPLGSPHTGTYIYNPDNNSWTTGPSTNVSHAYAGGTAIGNRLLMVGGYLYGAADDNIVEMATVSCAPPPSPTPTPTPSPTVTPSATPTATATVPPTPSPTATPSATATATVPPTVTPTPSDCPGGGGGGCPSPSVTPPVTATPSPTPSPPPTPPPSPTPSPTATPSPGPAQALNISTRLRVEAGDRIAIGGFIVTGTEPKKVAIRGIGPSLGNSGLSDLLADPTMELRDYNGVLLMQNDNWQDDSGQAAQLIALGLALPNPNESGMVATLLPGIYTVLLAGKNQTAGLALVEIYDADRAAASQLANLSTRGFVRTGDSVMIGGFILGGGIADANMVVRGLGPSLRRFMLIDVLDDPMLELRDANGALLIANDNWQDDPIAAAQLTAYGLAPTDDLEPAIFARLAPGAFTSIVVGKNGDVGIALLELYNVPTLVTNTADSGPGSLRDAIAAAGDGETIQFDTAFNGQTINLTSDELLIDKSIAITGNVTVQRSTAGGTPAFRIFHITPGHTVTIHGLTISNGFANMNNPSGGGVFNDQSTLTLSYCAVEYNYSAVGSGGGIYNSGSSAILTVAHSTVTNNVMEVEHVFICCGGGFGAGIFSDGTLAIDHSTVSNNQIGYIQNVFSGDGGGIYSSGGAVTISNSSVSGNFANRVAGGIFNRGTLEITNSTINYNESIRSGGGVYNEGTLAIDNSTFTGNISAELLAQGGGISNHATTTIIRTTFSENSADGDGGSIFNSGAIQIGNTILKAQSGGGNIFSEGGASTVTSLGYNLSSDNGGGFLTTTGDQINTNPMLGPLQDNGGPTFTHELLTGSSAINAGDPNFTPPPLYDQRGPGYDRVNGGRIDIGSFEVQPVGSAPRLTH